MSNISAALSRSCNSRTPRHQLREINSVLEPAVVTSTRELATALNAVESNILIAACAVMLFRYTALSNLQFQVINSAEEGELGSPEGARWVHNLEVSASTRFRSLLNSLCCETPLLPSNSAMPCISHTACPEQLANAVLHDQGDASENIRIDFLSSTETIKVRLGYRDDCLADVVAERFVSHLSSLLESLAAQPDVEIGRQNYLPATELRQVLEQGRGPSRDYVLTPVTELIAQQVEHHADALALEDARSRLTYRELMERSERIAKGLLAKGLPPRARVGVLLERSIDWIATIVGILRANMVYVPLSTRNPPARNEYIVSDCSVSLVISDAANRRHLAGQNDLIELAEVSVLAQGYSLSLPILDRDDDAYIIYTSGSTGLPKGVRITHEALSNYIIAAKEAFCLDMENPKNIQFAEASFDASILEIFFSICHGGSTFVYSRPEALSMAEFAATLANHAINIISPPTTFWHEWMDQIAAGRSQMPACVKVAVIGGEAAIPDKFCQADFPPEFRLFNAYGPTETTVDAAIYRCDCGVQNARHIPIGRPLPNVRLYVLDDQSLPVAVGVVGELCIGGAGVSPGYVGRDDLNSERFVTLDVPGIVHGERIYRTGDRAFFQQDGTLVCLGRRDSQIKISGTRVDLSEIEVRLNACDLVSQAVVTWEREATPEGTLTMHLRLREGVPRTSQTLERIVDQLRRYVPAHMVPRCHTFIDAFPVNASGKIDRARLPASSVSSIDVAVDVSSPRPPENPTERKLWDLWARMIPREPLASTNDDIFQKPVSSLKLGLFFAEIAVTWDVDIDIERLAETRTLCAVAKHLDELLAKSA